MAEINGETFPRKPNKFQKEKTTTEHEGGETRPHEHCVLKCKQACLLAHEADGNQIDEKPLGFLMRVFQPTEGLVLSLL